MEDKGFPRTFREIVRVRRLELGVARVSCIRQCMGTKSENMVALHIDYVLYVGGEPGVAKGRGGEWECHPKHARTLLRKSGMEGCGECPPPPPPR